jgi:hypothetical protein
MGFDLPNNDLNSIYPISNNLANWYSVRPYAFIFTPRNRIKPKMVIFLPINPSNLQIVTHMATNVVTTLYGVVEEHSEVRYYDITIQGTTGYAPKYITPSGTKQSMAALANNDPQPGRASMESSELIPSDKVGGFMSKTIGTINTVYSAAKKLLNIGGPDASGISIEASGYVAFHNLYRALKLYKADIAGQPGDKMNSLPIAKNTEHPLKFVNYKDGVEYNCVPITFTTTRSAESPMLYNYTITLRAYNLQPVNGDGPGAVDKLKDLGLNNAGPSLMYKAREKAMLATTAVAGIASLPTSLGQ